MKGGRGHICKLKAAVDVRVSHLLQGQKQEVRIQASSSSPCQLRMQAAHIQTGLLGWDFSVLGSRWFAFADLELLLDHGRKLRGASSPQVQAPMVALYQDWWPLILKLAKMVEPSFGPIFTGIEDPEDWLADFELWLLSMHKLTNVEKLHMVPLLMQEQSKFWVKSNQYMKISKLLECLHPKIREKVEDGADTYEDMVYLAKIKSKKLKRKLELGMLKPADYALVCGISRMFFVYDVHVPRVDELINKEKLHIEVNQGAKTIGDVGVARQLKEINLVLVENLHERVTERSQVADIKDLEAGEENEQSHEDGQAFGEQQADEGTDAELAYGANDDEDTSSSCWETSEEDTTDESTSYGEKMQRDKPELVKVKLPYYVLDDMVVANVQEEQRTEQANVHDEDQLERSRPIGDYKQGKLRFVGKNRAAMPMEEDKDEAIENKFLSSLTEYDAAEEQMIEEQVVEEQVVEADEQVVLMDLEGLVDEEELEDASINCMVGKEESKEPSMELPVLQVSSMTCNGDSQVEAKLLKEVCEWWLKGMVISVAIQKAIEQVQDLLEEDLALYDWEGGHDMFNVNDDIHLEIGDAFGGVLLEMGSLPMDPRSRESMSMVAYVDGWLDAQEWHYDKVLQVDGSDQS
ncbi:hypothetical protein L7F22_060009 [Adiantum nelumboides]|nr:hypothetical protein [Adiantum nelumboides]